MNVDKTLALPFEFMGREITVIDSSASFTLKSEYVSADGIDFVITGGYGYAVLKLS